MSTNAPSPIPPDVLADGQAVLDHLLTGKPLGPETYRRIRERAERITEALRQKDGQTNMAVDLMRAIRNEE